MFFSVFYFIGLRFLRNPFGDDRGWDLTAVQILMFQTLFLFWAACLGKIQLGCYLLVLAGLAYATLSFWKFRKSKRNVSLTDGLLGLILIIGFHCTMNMKVHFSDEFEIWGALLKYLGLFGELPKSNEIILFTSFIPGQALWLHFFSWFNPSAEASWYFSQFVFLILVISITLSLYTRQSNYDSFKKLIFFCLFFLIFFEFGISKKNHFALFNLGPDLQLAVYFFMGLLASQLETAQESDWLLFLSVTLTTTLKGHGVVLALISILVWLFVRQNERSVRSNIKTVICCLLLIAFIKVPWESYLAFYKIPKIYEEFQGPTFDFVKRSLLFSWTESEQSIFRMLVGILWERKLETFGVIIGIILGSTSRQRIRLLLLYLFGGISYFFMICVFYMIVLMKSFPDEALGGNSFDRIMYTYHLGWLLLILCLTITRFLKFKLQAPVLKAVIGFSIIALLFSIHHHGVHIEKWERAREILRPELLKIISKITIQEKVVLICQNKALCTVPFWTLMYEALPKRFDGDFAVVKKRPNLSYPKYNQIEWEPFLNRIQSSDFVFLRNVDDQFWNDFGPAFDKKKLGFFKIIKNQSGSLSDAPTFIYQEELNIDIYQ